MRAEMIRGRYARHAGLAGILVLSLVLGMTCKKKNQPPGVPSVPSGPSHGRKGDTLRFTAVAEDPDGDSVSVRLDWGDTRCRTGAGSLRMASRCLWATREGEAKAIG